jgi:hypothetical protein
MKQLNEILHQGDLCSLGLTVAILLWVGHRIRGRSDERISVGCAGLAFLGYAVYDFKSSRWLDAQELLHLVIRSLIAAGFALGLAMICVPLFVWGKHTLLEPLLQRLSFWKAGVQVKKVLREQRRWQEEENRRAHEAAERWEQGRPEREKQQRAKEAQRQEEYQAREEARADCEFLYSFHAPELRERFPRKHFELFLTKLAGKSLEQVPVFASKIKALIQGHVQKVEPSFGRKTRKELKAWFDSERALIEQFEDDEEMKATQLYFLKERYDELSRSLFKEMMP